MNEDGPASIIPTIPRVYSRCAIVSRISVEFDYGKDSVIVAIVCDISYIVSNKDS